MLQTENARHANNNTPGRHSGTSTLLFNCDESIMLCQATFPGPRPCRLPPGKSCISAVQE